MILKFNKHLAGDIPYYTVKFSKSASERSWFTELGGFAKNGKLGQIFKSFSGRWVFEPAIQVIPVAMMVEIADFMRELK